MAFIQNKYKEYYIAQNGQTGGLPLFDERNVTLPDWVWNGSDIKAEVYYKMKAKFQDDSFQYLRVLIIEFGGQATDHDIKSFFNDSEKWPLHIVSARRNFFLKGKMAGIVTGYNDKNGKPRKKTGPRGEPNTIWFVNFNQLYKILY